MHIKTNIELSVTNIAILALCPMMLAINSLYTGILYMSAIAICYLLAINFCLLLNKILSKNMKIFVIAILSSIFVLIYQIILNNMNIKLSITFDYIIFSTIILSVNNVYYETKANSESYIISITKTLGTFIVYLLIFSIFKEFLTSGKIYGYKLSQFSGNEIFAGLTFNLLFLGLMCLFGEYITRLVSSRKEQTEMKYNKFLKKVRHEKVYQYDLLRRQKLLEGNIEIINVDDDQEFETLDKHNNNEIAYVDGNELVGKIYKRKTKLKVSKSAQVEKMFDSQQSEKGGEK